MPPSLNTTLLQHFGTRLRSARRAANLSQQGLARQLGVGQDTISHYEQGQSVPGLVLLFHLAQVLCVDVRYFFPDEDFAQLTEADRETLALITSLSPVAYEYVLAFVRYFVNKKRHRSFLSHGRDSQHRLLMFLERDVQALEQTTQLACQQARRGVNPVDEDVPPLYALVSFTAVLLMGIEVETLDAQTEELVRRIAANGNRLAVLVRELMKTETAEVDV